MSDRTVTSVGDLHESVLGSRKADRIHQAVKRDVLLRVCPPGTQLLEQSLATDHGCSQSTVREALQKLAEEGLVERRGYQGTFVTETNLDEVAHMVRLRVSIERLAARRLSADGARTEVLIELTTLMDDAMAARDAMRVAELDRAFHAGLVRLSGLGQLAPILRRCALHIHRFTLGAEESPGRFTLDGEVGEEHRDLLAAITRGDAAEAEAAAVDHIEKVVRRWSPRVFAAVGDGTFVR